MDPQFDVRSHRPRISANSANLHAPSSGVLRRDFTGAAKIERYAGETLDFQGNMDLDRLLSPTVILQTFADRWTQIAFQLAEASVAHHATMASPRPLNLSFVINESALDSRQASISSWTN